MTSDLQNVKLSESSSQRDSPGHSTGQFWANNPALAVITSCLLSVVECQTSWGRMGVLLEVTKVGPTYMPVSHLSYLLAPPAPPQ